MVCEFDNTSMVGTPIEWRHVTDKQNIQRKHKPHLLLNTQPGCQNYVIRIVVFQVFQFHPTVCNINASTLEYILTPL